MDDQNNLLNLAGFYLQRLTMSRGAASVTLSGLHTNVDGSRSVIEAQVLFGGVEHYSVEGTFEPGSRVLSHTRLPNLVAGAKRGEYVLQLTAGDLKISAGRCGVIKNVEVFEDGKP